MSVGKRVKEAIEKYRVADYGGALIPACIAVAASAKKIYPYLRHDREQYKSFLSDNLDVITLIALGLPIQGISFKVTHPELRKPQMPDNATLTEILYHIVRCGLIHNAELDPKISFGQSNELGLLDNTVIIPPELIEGLLMAVIGANCNESERLPGGSYEFTFRQIGGDVVINLDKLWGQKTAIMELMCKTLPKYGNLD